MTLSSIDSPETIELATETSMRIAIINRCFPPDPAVTGQDANSLVAELANHFPRAEFRVYSVASNYAGGLACTEAMPVRAETHRISAVYNGRRPSLRLVASLYEGYRLAQLATSWADLVISMSDPPLLGFWVGRLADRKGVRWIEWTMDLYPEAFLAAGLASTANPMLRYVQGSLQKNPPDHYICLGPQQHRAVNSYRENSINATVMPCGICDTQERTRPKWLENEERVTLSYAGNIGEAHSYQALIDLVVSAEVSIFQCILSPFGKHRDRVVASVESQSNIIFRDGLDRSELAAMDVHIVSLADQWTDVCVPSKAVSAICLGRPIIFCGSPESDTWKMLGDAGWLIPEQEDGTYRASDIRSCLNRVADSRERKDKEMSARSLGKRLRESRTESYLAIAEKVTRLCNIHEVRGEAAQFSE